MKKYLLMEEADMLQTGVAVLKLQESQVKKGADLLAGVFQHDPMMHYLVGDPTAHWDGHAHASIF